MDLIEKIISQASQYLVCPVCSSHFENSEIKLRGFIDNTYIFQAICAKKHSPLAVTYLASLHKLEKPTAYFHLLTGKKITPSLKKQAIDLFDNFNGDFTEIEFS